MPTVAPTKIEVNHIKKLVKSQREYFRSGETLNVDFRIKQLRKLKTAINEFEAEILDALHKDLRRDEVSGYILEVGFVLNELQDTVKKLKKWARPTKVTTPLFHAKASSRIHSEPFGTTLIIAPWNYPFQLLIAPLIGALAAGNTAIIKPSEVSPNTSLVIGRLIEKHFDPKYLAVVQGGIPESQALLKEKFDYIFYTGSTAVGKIVYQAAAKNLTPVTLELGGKSPCIVDKNTNLELSAKRIIWGKLVNAGQTCIAPDYILVQKEIKDKLIQEFEKQIGILYGENPKESVEYCRIINEKHFDRLSNLLSSGTTSIGGETDRSDKYISPTVLENVSSDDPVMEEEIFGPILPVIEYDDTEDAIKFVNDRPKPLSLYIFSNRQSVINKITKQTSSGGVCINDTLMHIGNPYLPFGGVGESGIGAYHGKSSFDTFSHKKSILHKSFLIDVPIRYTPYTQTDFTLLKSLMKYFNK